MKYAQEVKADLLVMGAHGHGVLKDLIFGDTINPVRHALKIPILVVRSPLVTQTLICEREKA